jgi:hypothetical protein
MHESRSPLARYGPWKPAARYWHGNEAEWDIVAESLDGKRLLLGEAKWTDATVSEKALARAVEELKAKGIPGGMRGKEREIIHALFIPRGPSRHRSQRDAPIVDARDVTSCLR